ncbi:hypothetical protein [Pseudonocardia sp. McavD-2-B]|nr:hypothetical protein [Pseudonocardia sp. McavD-2-B]
MTLTTVLGPPGVSTGPAPADAAALEDAGAAPCGSPVARSTGPTG